MVDPLHPHAGDRIAHVVAEAPVPLLPALAEEAALETLFDFPAIRAMFDKLFTDFSDIWHGNFVHTADPQTNAVCSQFTVLITPNGGEELRYENCNRFYLKDRLFHRVYVYMSGDNLLKEGDA